MKKKRKVHNYDFNLSDSSMCLQVNSIIYNDHLSAKDYYCSSESDPIMLMKSTSFNRGLTKVNKMRTKVDSCRNGVDCPDAMGFKWSSHYIDLF